MSNQRYGFWGYVKSMIYRYPQRQEEYRETMAQSITPMVMQIYNHYRKHRTAAYWQMHGMKVYPTISWSDEIMRKRKEKRKKTLVEAEGAAV